MEEVVDFLASREIVALVSFGTLLGFAYSILRVLLPRIASLAGKTSRAARDFSRKQLIRKAVQMRKLRKFDNPLAKAVSAFIFRGMMGTAMSLGGIGYSLMTFSTVDLMGPTPFLDQASYLLALLWFMGGTALFFRGLTDLYESSEWYSDPDNARKMLLEEIANLRKHNG